MMNYIFNGVSIEARQISWFWGLWTNTIVSKGVIYSKQYLYLSRRTQLEEYTHIRQEGELGWKFRPLYVIFWLWNVIRLKKKCYENIPFELEAKLNTTEEYIITRPANNWKNYIHTDGK